MHLCDWEAEAGPWLLLPLLSPLLLPVTLDFYHPSLHLCLWEGVQGSEHHIYFSGFCPPYPGPLCPTVAPPMVPHVPQVWDWAVFAPITQGLALRPPLTPMGVSCELSLFRGTGFGIPEPSRACTH